MKAVLIKEANGLTIAFDLPPTAYAVTLHTYDAFDLATQMLELLSEARRKALGEAS